MRNEQFPEAKTARKSTTQEKNCLYYCLKGMDDRLFDFYWEHKPLYKVMLSRAKTREEKIHKFLYFPNAYYLSIALDKLTNQICFADLNAIRIAFNESQNEFEIELEETLKANQALLLSVVV